MVQVFREAGVAGWRLVRLLETSPTDQYRRGTEGRD